MSTDTPVAIVTGAGSGIGAAISRRLAADGYHMVLSDLDDSRLAPVAASIPGSVVHLGDLSRAGTGDALVAVAVQAWGRLDVLVNNAGGGVILPTLQHTEETLQATIDRNLWTTIRCTLAAIPVMQAAGYGRVVNIGADSVKSGVPAHAMYNAAKGGVHAMVGGLAREFARDGITFNVVAPCMVLTDEVQVMWDEKPAFMQPFLDVIPVGRPAKMEEVASAVAYLASAEAAFITGQVIGVNGGSNFLG
ncbi:MAG: SDR family oxidoreductase [Actinomycetota bacterium]|nr:SDR family oxidoreductase [Actinomycetota bacterium]